MSRKEQILSLKKEGKTYKQISEILGCSINNVWYHVSPNAKKLNTERMRRLRKKQHPYKTKLDKFTQRKYKPKTFSELKNVGTRTHIYRRLRHFNVDRKTKEFMKTDITTDDVIKKLGENPICYLTGEPININNSRSYQFDHIIPASRGGDNSLENLGICTKQINMAKNNMTADEFIFLCRKVVAYQDQKLKEVQQAKT